jgi:hypothetical protein
MYTEHHPSSLYCLPLFFIWRESVLDQVHGENLFELSEMSHAKSKDSTLI